MESSFKNQMIPTNTISWNRYVNQGTENFQTTSSRNSGVESIITSIKRVTKRPPWQIWTDKKKTKPQLKTINRSNYPVIGRENLFSIDTA